MIKLIIFDLWGTLGTKGFAVHSTFAQHFNIGDSQYNHQKYEESVQLRKWNSKEAMVKNFLKIFDLPLTGENIGYCIDKYDEGIKQASLFEFSIDLIKKLKSEYRLVLISNTTNFEIGLIDRMGIRQYFDKVLCSHDIGFLKPSEKIFSAIRNRFNVEYSECLFIDDSVKNTSSAEKLGLNVIQYINFEQLKKELTSYSIIVD